MNRKRVWRYYCEFCKKSGCSAGHMKHHENNCTMNPNRKCGMCEYTENEQASIVDLLKALKADILEYKKDNTFDRYNEVGTYLMENVYSVPLNKLRNVSEGCPACILAAIRQSGISQSIEFDFKKEKEEFWAGYNESQKQDDYDWRF